MTSVASIVIGERRREDYGDLAELAASIERFGLLHPIVVDDAGNLIAGERRLRACQLLYWTDVDTRNLGDLTEAERREIELEENLRRKDLTAYERSKTTTELAAAAQTVAQSCVESTHETASKRISRRDVAERTGIPEPTIRQAERHVETVDQFIPATGPGWAQYHVLEARTHLDKLPEADRPKAAALIDQPGTPPKEALQMLGNLASMPAEKREYVLTLATSTDVRDQSLAKTTLAEKPPMPDPRLTRLDRAIAELKGAVTPFPDDPFTPRIRAQMTELRAIASEIEQGCRNGHA